MRIALFTSCALDRSGKERDAAVALAGALSDHGIDVLLVGTARGAQEQTAGRLIIRALERSGASALARTGTEARQIAVCGPAWTWSADAAVRRIIGQGLHRHFSFCRESKMTDKHRFIRIGGKGTIIVGCLLHCRNGYGLSNPQPRGFGVLKAGYQCGKPFDTVPNGLVHIRWQRARNELWIIV